MVVTKKIGERVKHIREEKNYSQEFVASKLGISQKAYSKIETGETKLSVENLIKISEILDTSINTILETGAVYNNFSTHNGEGIVISKTVASDKIEELYNKLIKAKDDEIERLKNQNDSFLKTIEKIAGQKSK
jgi:transcriptional regulator with XRE-family HTH domain